MTDNNFIFPLSKAVGQAFSYNLISWQRPAKRSEYWTVLIMVGVLSCLVFCLPSITGFPKSNIAAQVYAWLWNVVLIYFLWVRLSLYVRRLRDIGCSSWWAIVGFIGCFFVLVLSGTVIYKVYHFLQPYIICGIRPKEEIVYRVIDALLHSNTVVSLFYNSAFAVVITLIFHLYLGIKDKKQAKG